VNNFEKAILAFLEVAQATVPLFVHSQKGILIYNTSEELATAILQQLTNAQSQVATQPTTETVPGTTNTTTINIPPATRLT
jgi:hypothetical protein